MRISPRFAPVLFSAILSAVMVAIVSGYVLITTQGLHAGFFAMWGRSGLRTWPIAFPTVWVVAPLVRRLVARLTTPVVAAAALLLLAIPHAATAQQDTPRRWRLLVSSGTLIPTGAQRTVIARGGVTVAQLAWVPGRVAVTASLGWARTRDVTTAAKPKVDALLYDIGAELRGSYRSLGVVAAKPFAGVGVGARSYDYRAGSTAATHNLTGFVSAGGEVDLRRVQLRLEVRDYLSGFAPLAGTGARATRNDVMLLAGLRLGGPR
jgi:hypothetical protein